MQLLLEHTAMPIDLKNVIVLGKIEDVRVAKLEQSVAAHFGVSVHTLNDWKHDSDAKLMLCFLLCNTLQYSIGSVAKHYAINRLYLKNKIVDQYQKCLLDASEMMRVNALVMVLYNTTVTA